MKRNPKSLTGHSLPQKARPRSAPDFKDVTGLRRLVDSTTTPSLMIHGMAVQPPEMPDLGANRIW